MDGTGRPPAIPKKPTVQPVPQHIPVYDRDSVMNLVRANVDVVSSANTKKITSSVSSDAVIPQQGGKSELLITNVLQAVLVKCLQSYKYAPNPEEPDVCRLNLCRRTILVDLGKPLQTVSALRQVVEALSDLEELEKREAQDVEEMEARVEIVSDGGIPYLHQYKPSIEEKASENGSVKPDETEPPEDDKQGPQGPEDTGQFEDYVRPLSPPLPQPLQPELRPIPIPQLPIQLPPRPTPVPPRPDQVILIEDTSDEYNSEEYDSEELRRWGKRRKTEKSSESTPSERPKRRTTVRPVQNDSRDTRTPPNFEADPEELERWGMKPIKLPVKRTAPVRSTDENRRLQDTIDSTLTSQLVGLQPVLPAPRIEHTAQSVARSTEVNRPSFSPTFITDGQASKAQVRTPAVGDVQLLPTARIEKAVLIPSPSMGRVPEVEVARTVPHQRTPVEQCKSDNQALSSSIAMMSPVVNNAQGIEQKKDTGDTLSESGTFSTAHKKDAGTPKPTHETFEDPKAKDAAAMNDHDHNDEINESRADKSETASADASDAIKAESSVDPPEAVKSPSPVRPTLRRSRRGTRSSGATTPIAKLPVKTRKKV
ncbi:hypothetical protein BJ508DRAFT_372925 [Ascobolus immersus RN42]|uniref:Uncharacterized protein n=1 Tax=Ascobolus immersus RN42 TaxID=1160509 RepID=A0A3N4IPM5_ASCIM|nr:hypothetical protein BJ508DRAFT_372925 [Ascobolus immersus RN42]